MIRAQAIFWLVIFITIGLVQSFLSPLIRLAALLLALLGSGKYRQWGINVWEGADNAAPAVFENVFYSMYFWVSPTAKSNGAEPYILTDNNGLDYNFILDSAYDGLTLEAKCEKHFTDVILPTLV